MWKYIFTIIFTLYMWLCGLLHTPLQNLLDSWWVSSVFFTNLQFKTWYFFLALNLCTIWFIVQSMTVYHSKRFDLSLSKLREAYLEKRFCRPGPVSSMSLWEPRVKQILKKTGSVCSCLMSHTSDKWKIVWKYPYIFALCFMFSNCKRF